MVVCIALYDIGEFARFYPNGKAIVNTKGGKDKAMGMISDTDQNIQRYALQCLSKLMVSHWESVN